jgi:hypothetical protein
LHMEGVLESMIQTMGLVEGFVGGVAGMAPRAIVGARSLLCGAEERLRAVELEHSAQIARVEETRAQFEKMDMECAAAKAWLADINAQFAAWTKSLSALQDKAADLEHKVATESERLSMLETACETMRARDRDLTAKCDSLLNCYKKEDEKLRAINGRIGAAERKLERKLSELQMATAQEAEAIRGVETAAASADDVLRVLLAMVRAATAEFQAAMGRAADQNALVAGLKEKEAFLEIVYNCTTLMAARVRDLDTDIGGEVTRKLFAPDVNCVYPGMRTSMKKLAFHLDGMRTRGELKTVYLSVLATECNAFKEKHSDVFDVKLVINDSTLLDFCRRLFSELSTHIREESRRKRPATAAEAIRGETGQSV